MRKKLAIAWLLALAPIVLFVPALALAGLGPCSFSHPQVMLAAFLLFVILEIAALPQFVRAVRAGASAVLAMIGMGLALFVAAFSATFGYYFLADYWA